MSVERGGLDEDEAMFQIDDELHGEPQGEFDTFEDAMSELERRSKFPWDADPNKAPCMSWRTCGRNYEVVEYDDSQGEWKELSRTRVLEIRASGTTWIKKPY
jgi:hypothetical protein